MPGIVTRRLYISTGHRDPNKLGKAAFIIPGHFSRVRGLTLAQGRHPLPPNTPNHGDWAKGFSDGRWAIGTECNSLGGELSNKKGLQKGYRAGRCNVMGPPRWSKSHHGPGLSHRSPGLFSQHSPGLSPSKPRGASVRAQHYLSHFRTAPNHSSGRIPVTMQCSCLSHAQSLFQHPVKIVLVMAQDSSHHM